MPPEIIITDHALVRYMERVKGHDLDAVREEMKEIVMFGGGMNATPPP